MKKCPECGMTLDAQNYCPLCGTDIAAEPYLETYRQRRALNSWLPVYIVGFGKFFVVCACGCLTMFFLRLPQLRWGDLWGFCCLALCSWQSFQATLMRRFWLRIFSEEFTELLQPLIKYGSGLAALYILFR